MQESAVRTAAFIPWAKPVFWGNEKEYVLQALASTWISAGPFVERLERDFRRHFNSKHSVAVSSGTAALHASYLAMRIRPGDEIVVPGFAFMAAANAALHVGAKPVFADVDPVTWCVTAEEIAKRLSPRTRLIVAVHTYGGVCEMDPILTLADQYQIPVLEDAAEALGSRYRGSFVGTRGAVGTFSFHAAKTITTGEGGMVVTRDPDIQFRLRLYRNQGVSDKRYFHEVVGHNFRLTDLQAALGCAQLEHWSDVVRERRRIYDRYTSLLAGQEGIQLQELLPDVEPVLWAMAIKLDRRVFRMCRDQVIERLKAERIETRPGFASPSSMSLYSVSTLKVTNELSEQILSLPTFATLSNPDIDYVCEKLLSLRM